MNKETTARKDCDPPIAVSAWNWKYHHTGIPTQYKRPGEKYIPGLKMHVSGFPESPYGIEWMRFEEDSPIHPLIQKFPHVAFEVENLDAELDGKKILVQPTKPSEGVRVAIIEDNGAPVELMEFKNDKSNKKSLI